MAGLEKIGLAAVLDDRDFQSGLFRYTKGVGQMTSLTDSAAKVLTGAFVAGIGAVTIAASGVVAAAKVGLDATLAWAEQLDKLSDQFGFSGEVASGWAFLMNRVGLTVEEGGQGLNYFTNQLGGFGKTMKDGTLQVTPFSTALSKLGVDAIDPATKKLKTFDQIMPEIMDKFQKLPSGINASALAMDLFGARGGTKFLDLLRQGSSGLEDAKKKADALGLTLGTETVNAAEEFGFKLNEMNLGLEGIKNQIGIVVLPVISSLVDKINADVLPAFATWAKENAPKLREALDKLGTALGTVRDWIVANGPGIMAPIQAGFASFKKWWDDNDIAGAIVSGLKKVKNFLDVDMPPVIDRFRAKMAENALIRDDWLKFLGEIKAATASTFGDINADASIKLPSLADIVENTLGMINTRSQGQLDTLRGIWKASNALIRLDLVGFEQGVNQTWTGMITDMAAQVGINFPRIQQDMRSGWQSILQYLETLVPEFRTAAQDMMQGLIDGFWDEATAIEQALSDIIDAAIEEIKRRLGIGSPSKVFAAIGENMMQGMLQGFQFPDLAFAPTVAAAVNRSLPGSAPVNMYSSTRTMSTYDNSRKFTFSGNVVFQGVNPPATQAQADHAADLFVSALRGKGVDV